MIYCHGNSWCRADANEVAVVLLPSNITVFALDFSGSGPSDGDYVSLGWHEKEDLKCAVSFLRTNKQVSRIDLRARSMGAVTSLLHGAEELRDDVSAEPTIWFLVLLLMRYMLSFWRSVATTYGFSAINFCYLVSVLASWLVDNFFIWFGLCWWFLV